MLRAGTSSCTALTLGRVGDPATREAAMSMRKRIGLPSPCGAAAGAATLGTSIVIAGNPPVPIELNPALT